MIRAHALDHRDEFLCGINQGAIEVKYDRFGPSDIVVHSTVPGFTARTM